MATPKSTYPKATIENGLSEINLSSWPDFNEIVKKLLNHPNYIFRGHRRNDWDLESTLTRKLRKKAFPPSAISDHIEAFRYAIRGRRGTNPSSLSETELWALGQHHGLATSLLDWTASPYVALFFAFAKTKPEDETDTRVVFALNETKVRGKNKELGAKGQENVIEFIRPMSDENARLVNQNGLFIKSPPTMTIENWVTTNFSGHRKIILAKVYIPNSDRQECLLALNKMNINYATLFPDL